VTLNLSKSTASLSFGPRGAQYTISPRGNRATLGLPGSGLFYTLRDRKSPKSAPAMRDRLNLGFFRRLVTPAEDQALVDGLRALHEGRESEALAQFETASDLADAAWMAGMIRLRQEAFAQARAHLDRALTAGNRLGERFAKYDLSPRIDLPIAKGITAHVLPTERGTRLALVELCKIIGDSAAAKAHLDRLLTIAPDDPVVLLSFVQIALDMPGDTGQMDRVIALSADTPNETPIDTGILLFRARALAAKGLPDAAIEVLTRASRRRKDRPDRLLRQIRYDRAALYDAVGRKAQARREFEKLHAEAPGFEGVAAKLGLG
jgi:tetratricopeptide (TPR) repeat protein